MSNEKEVEEVLLAIEKMQKKTKPARTPISQTLLLFVRHYFKELALLLIGFLVGVIIG